MRKYPEYSKLDLPELDKEMLKHWASANTFEKSIEERPADKPWVFYEGPPSANGKPGIHHVMARTVKDLFCRYHTMLGYRVERKGGWDTHGLPVELKVESELGITKDDIGKSISVAEYNAKCRETVMKFKKEWDVLTVKMGYWVDLDKPYVTYENDYIESVWWLLSQLYKKNLMYKGYTIQPFSPAAGTGLSSHELNMPGAYKEVKDTTVVGLWKLSRSPTGLASSKQEVALPAALAEIKGQVLVSAWTTTPWTLPSNTGLTVGPKIQYVVVRTNNPYTQEEQHIVIAADLVGKWFGGKNQPAVLEQSEPFSGKELEGLRYEPIFDFGNPIEPIGDANDAYKIILGDFVTTADGTGIVHTAPSFGADDRRVGVAAGLGALTLVDEQGKFKDTVGPFSGRYVKNYRDDKNYVDVNIDLSVDLKLRGQALNVSKYEHNYPHCWRTDKPVLYYPLDSWFIKASSMRARMMELNDTINWKPESTGTKRFGNWLENVQDWNLSRSRYWGIPLPIWRSEDGVEEICIGSIEELRKEIEVANNKLSLKQEVPSDLHRPYIDEVVLWKNGKKMVREADLIDVWFDSGSMPYAQWHYPFENKEIFERNFPAAFIAEGVDQTRGWFYTLHAISTMVFDSVAYKNVVSNGLVLDKDGQKMSKRLGNAVDPFVTIDKYGADATRWYMLTNAAPWDNLKFDEKGIGEVQRKFFGTLYNTYGFFSLYANVDGWDGSDAPASHTDIDRWLLSRMNSLLRDVKAAYEAFEPMTAGRLVQSFVTDQLSNWYVRLNRKRFWRGELTDDKRAAYFMLKQALGLTAQLMAPIAPFYADRLYRDLGLGESVHLSLLPEVDTTLIDEALEERMDYAQRISSLGFSLRKTGDRRVRQPLAKLLIPVLNADFETQVKQVEDLILQELNVKEIEYVSGDALSRTIKPNFRVLGKKVGKQMKAAAAIINELDAAAISALESTGAHTIDLEGTPFKLSLDDVEIAAQDIPGWSIASDGPLTVALDLTLTPALEMEGLARELVNRIQNLRKDAGLEVTDRIQVEISENAFVAEVLTAHKDYISSEVLADAVTMKAGVTGTATDLGEGVGEVMVKVEKV